MPTLLVQVGGTGRGTAAAGGHMRKRFLFSIASIAAAFLGACSSKKEEAPRAAPAATTSDAGGDTASAPLGDGDQVTAALAGDGRIEITVIDATGRQVAGRDIAGTVTVPGGEPVPLRLDAASGRLVADVGRTDPSVTAQITLTVPGRGTRSARVELRHAPHSATGPGMHPGPRAPGHEGAHGEGER